MLNAGLSKVFCVNMIMCVFGFHSRMLFILRLFSFAAFPWLLPSQPAAALQPVAREGFGAGTLLV